MRTKHIHSLFKPFAYSLLLILPLFVPAQNQNKIDSLLKRKAQLENINPPIKQGAYNRDTTLVQTLNDLASEMENSYPDTSRTLATQALALAQKINWQTGIARSYNNIAISHYYKGNYVLASLYNHKALEIWETLLKTAKPDRKLYLLKRKSSSLANLGLYYWQQDDYSKALEYSLQALKINEKLGDKNGIAGNLGQIGNVHFQHGDYPKALEYYFKALTIDEELKNKSGISRHLGNTGNAYWKQGDYPKALECYFKALQIDEELENKKGISLHLGNIGLVYAEQKDNPKALHYYSQALKTDEELGNKNGIARHLGNIANIYYDQKNYPHALECHLKALKIYEELMKKDGIAVNLDNIGVIYWAQKDYPRALEYYFKALKIDEELGKKNRIAKCFNHIGVVFSDQKKYQEAEKFLLKSIKLFEEIGDLYNAMVVNQDLSEFYANIGRYQLSLEHYKKAMVVKDSLFNEDKNKEITRKEMNYEFDKKEQKMKFEHEKETASLTQQAQLLALENSRNKYIIYGLSSAGLLLIIISILFIRHQKLKAKQKAIELEQKLLLSQMNPHFIFNALHAIQSFMYTNDIKESARYLSNFARLMRMILENSRQEFITLEKEINTLNHYLSLQQLRFENKFSFSMEIDPAIDKETMGIPPMFAQPFIENALEHGIKNKDTKGKIDIRFKISNGTILFEVEDNGIGRKRAQELSLMSDKGGSLPTMPRGRRAGQAGTSGGEGKGHESLATTITNERIEAFNKKHSKKITLDIVDMDNNGEYGTKVVFQIPYKLLDTVTVSLN